MIYRTAFQMEPIASITPKLSSSGHLLMEALARGFEVFHYEPKHMQMRDGRLYAYAAPLLALSQEKGSERLGEYAWTALDTMQSIHVRQDPPFNMEYITATYYLEQLPSSVRVVNDPSAVRSSPEKLLPLMLPEYLSPTLISRDAQELRAAVKGECVIKPLYGHHGNDVFRLRESNAADIITKALALNAEPWILQPFIPEIETEGNTRALFIGGELVGAFRIVPQQGEFLLYRGSTNVAHELNPREAEICAKVSALLKKRNLFYVGIDIIGGQLIEINVTSTGSIDKFNALYPGRRIEVEYWDALVQGKGHA